MPAMCRKASRLKLVAVFFNDFMQFGARGDKLSAACCLTGRRVWRIQPDDATHWILCKWEERGHYSPSRQAFGSFVPICEETVLPSQ
ncbi:hypothetical protein EMIT0196MI5_390009 [Pseudomonas sp. IT-196MI5]